MINFLRESIIRENKGSQKVNHTGCRRVARTNTATALTSAGFTRVRLLVKRAKLAKRVMSGCT